MESNPRMVPRPYALRNFMMAVALAYTSNARAYLDKIAPKLQRAVRDHALIVADMLRTAQPSTLAQTITDKNRLVFYKAENRRTTLMLRSGTKGLPALSSQEYTGKQERTRIFMANMQEVVREKGRKRFGALLARMHGLVYEDGLAIVPCRSVRNGQPASSMQNLVAYLSFNGYYLARVQPVCLPSQGLAHVDTVVCVLLLQRKASGSILPHPHQPSQLALAGDTSNVQRYGPFCARNMASTVRRAAENSGESGSGPKRSRSGRQIKAPLSVTLIDAGASDVEELDSDSDENVLKVTAGASDESSNSDPMEGLDDSESSSSEEEEDSSEATGQTASASVKKSGEEEAEEEEGSNDSSSSDADSELMDKMEKELDKPDEEGDEESDEDNEEEE